MALKKKTIEPRYWTLIYYSNGKGNYRMVHIAAYTLEDADMEAKKADATLTTYTLWWHASEYLETIHNKFTPFQSI